MSDGTTEALARLEEILRGIDGLAVAVSGGVDSVTLGAVAARILGERAAIYHAVSPAVPAEATQRVRAIAAARGWQLHVVDAGEFASEDYLRNPVDRCFHCKSHLYAALAGLAGVALASGTNVDDLSDYRPGLQAAKHFAVRHPYVEAGIDKAMVRRIAREEGLGEVAELPASPCLSSRIETGIRIHAPVLSLVDALESELRRDGRWRDVRCRVRKQGLVIELDEAALAVLDAPARVALESRIAAFLAARGHAEPFGVAPYRRGSAFLRETA